MRRIDLFTAPGCPGCHAARLTVEAFAGVHAEVAVHEWDLTYDPGPAASLGIFATPALLLDGRRVMLGAPTMAELAAHFGVPEPPPASGPPAAGSRVLFSGNPGVVGAGQGRRRLGAGIALCLVAAALGAVVWKAPEGRPRAAERAATDVVPFDHGALDALVRRHVDRHGLVDYVALAGDAGKLDGYLEAVARAPLASMEPRERLAFLINTYNACVLKTVLERWPVASIRDISGWEHRPWLVGRRWLTLRDLAEREIRERHREPRVHFALVCAARGCAPLRGEAYRAERLEEQLEDQARRAHHQPGWFGFDPGTRVAYVSQVYDWYRRDFEEEAGSLPAFLARYSPDLRSALAQGPPAVQWIRYDWSLNAAPHPRL